MTNLVMYRGNTQRFPLTIEDEDGTPIPLTGAKVWFTGKKSITDLDADAVFRLTTDVGGGITVLDADAGLVVATLQPSHTTSLPVGKLTQLFYDWKIKDAAGEIRTLRTGTILVRPIVTQATT